MWWLTVTHGRGTEVQTGEMEWVDGALHTTSERGLSVITTADAHTSAASSRLNWCSPPDLNRLVRFAGRRNLVSARVPSHFNWPLLDKRTYIYLFVVQIFLKVVFKWQAFGRKPEQLLASTGRTRWRCMYLKYSSITYESCEERRPTRCNN